MASQQEDVASPTGVASATGAIGASATGVTGVASATGAIGASATGATGVASSTSTLLQLSTEIQIQLIIGGILSKPGFKAFSSASSSNPTILFRPLLLHNIRLAQQ